jgi:hypothetical protein
LLWARKKQDFSASGSTQQELVYLTISFENWFLSEFVKKWTAKAFVACFITMNIIYCGLI